MSMKTSFIDMFCRCVDFLDLFGIYVEK